LKIKFFSLFYDVLDNLDLDEIDRIRDDALNSGQRRLNQF